MKPLGDGFIKLIKMMIAPIIFCTVVVGIAGMERHEDGRADRRPRRCSTSRSSRRSRWSIGLVVVNVVQPGAGINVDPATLDAKARRRLHDSRDSSQSTVDFLLNIIPNTVVDAFAKGDILQVLLFSVLFGFALLTLGEPRARWSSI